MLALGTDAHDRRRKAQRAKIKNHTGIITLAGVPPN
jgi:hypothetical protein